MARNEGRRLDHKTPEAIRIRAVEQVQAGESPEAVIRTLGFPRTCIYNWLAAYRAGGWHALRAKPLHGRPRILSSRDMKWIYDTVTRRNPLQYKFAFAPWTRRMIQVLIDKLLGVRLSPASIGRLSAQMGLTCQKPPARAFRQKPAMVAKWLRDEYPAIRARARRIGAEISFGDEAGVRSD